MTKSSIIQTIEDIEEYINTCKTSLLNKDVIMVNRNEIEEMLADLKQKTPDEIRRYQAIIKNRDEILEEARMKAEKLVEETTKRTNEMLSEHEIMQQAYAQANEVITKASSTAESILNSATEEANDMRSSATDYTEQLLEHVQEVIGRSLQAADANHASMVTDLKQYFDIISGNLAELNGTTTEAGGEEGNANGSGDADLELI